VSDTLPQIIPVTIVQAGNHDVALPTLEAQEFHLVREISPVPLSAEPLLGVTIISGEAALVVDLPTLLDQPRRSVWPPDLGLWARAANESLVLVGGQVRWIGRLRRTNADVESSLAEGAVEWKGATLPLLSWELVLEACLQSEDDLLDDLF